MNRRQYLVTRCVAAVADLDDDLNDDVFQVNGRQCLGWEMTSVQRLLDNAQGEVMLGIARKKEERIDVSFMSLEMTLVTFNLTDVF